MDRVKPDVILGAIDERLKLSRLLNQDNFEIFSTTAATSNKNFWINNQIYILVILAGVIVLSVLVPLSLFSKKFKELLHKIKDKIFFSYIIKWHTIKYIHFIVSACELFQMVEIEHVLTSQGKIEVQEEQKSI